MADKSIDQLNAAEKVYATDLFVLQQSGTAKKLTGQVLENWLVSFADGHGGIQSIQKVSTSGLVDTYRITLADTTIFDFVVTNGRGINSIAKTSTSGLVDTYTITYNNGTTSKFTVTNGAKGDKGDNAYVWIKYASQEPTESSNSMGDIPDDWIGFYSGNASSAPSDWKQYQWYKVKGEKGDTGDAATLLSKSVTYQSGDSGSIIPSGAWVSSVPVVSQGKYLWTKTELQFNTGDPIVSYSVARMGIDGSGSVSTVNNVSPDETGNVPLTAADVGALAVSGGDMEGPINMNGQPITGLNDPTEDTQAARKAYVDNASRKARPFNILDNSDFRNPVNQRGAMEYSTIDKEYAIDRWIRRGGSSDSIAVDSSGIKLKKNSTAYTAIKQAINTGEHILLGKSVTAVVKIKEISGTGELRITGGAVAGNDTIVYARTSFNTAGIHIINYTIPDTVEYDYIGVGIMITNSGEYLIAEWAALYEGEYTAETSPEYQPKGYAAELAECQRYFRQFISTNGSCLTMAGHVTTASSECICAFALDPVMRINPTATISGGIVIRGVGGYSNEASVTSPYVDPAIYVYVTENNRVSGIRFKKTDGSAWSGLTNNTPITVAPTSGTVITLSADL